MRRARVLIVVVALLGAIVLPAAPSGAATPIDDLVELCEGLYGETFGTPNTEPLGPCQWDMALINAGTDSYRYATGKGVTVGVIDGGIDLNHPDLAPNVDVGLSCSFIFDDDPLALDVEKANGDCSLKEAVQDLDGHGTHVATTIAAPVNGIGIAGVAPEATIVGLKACSIAGYCFAPSVAAALRYSGDVGLDVVNLSLFADPYLFYCKNEADQRQILRELEAAVRYARQRGVTIVSSAGNEQADLQHPGTDDISPDFPIGAAIEREVGNQCVVAPAELPGVTTVSATGPIGIEGYDLLIADYSSVGMSRVDVTAPGGDYFQATGTVQDAIIAGITSTSDSGTWDFFDGLNGAFPGITTTDAGGRYAYLNGTSMSSPHAAGVAALIVERHPNWRPGAVEATVQRTAQNLPCPADWQPLGPQDERERCYGGGGKTSFFGHGLVDALAAATS